MVVAPQTSKEVVAHHEAAHAIAAVELGVPGSIAFIQVDDDDLAGGRVRFVPGTASVPFTDVKAHDWIIQQLVGAEAEARITNELPTARSGAQDDYERARSYAERFKLAAPADPDENPSRIERDDYEVEAQEFVEKHWGKIVKVANEILARPTVRTKTMTGGDVYDLLSK